MIEIKPAPNFSIQCPSCGYESVSSGKLFFQGMHILREEMCEGCGLDYFATIPIGHDAHFPTQFSKDYQFVSYVPRAKDWLAMPLIEGMKEMSARKVTFTLTSRQLHKEVVIVNCLDNCFGHVFTKLWNTYSLMDNKQDVRVIVLIPSQFRWLLPEGVDEAWLVHLPLKLCHIRIQNLDKWIKDQLLRFNRVFLCETYTHLDQSLYVDVEKMLRISRFELSTFSSKRPCITFVLREDRFWHGSKLLSIVINAFTKIGKIKTLKFFLVSRQNDLINRTAKNILDKIPHAHIFATGLGKTGKLWTKITDLRVFEISYETEQKWNSTYAKSHLVIGIHGSNMLIPSGLAAGFIEILPRHKLDHIGEDTLLPYTNRFLHFLGRYIDEYATPKLAALHAVSMIRHFPYFYKNTIQKPEGFRE
ncbi:hypothetical protein [Anditalea andensis]|uniref:Uncharacterized protein n=1 Tax=Anditalea andensis TaxID=1048983 RepID=A0A074LLB0_9BACT|nr:hypothetical protein [Anditalea andensis]KEO74612.1 hypothetical protein EL17_02755 [Anditalea andensis]